MAIFVESDIHAPLDELWSRTQDPSVHERWDLRFSTIRYAGPPAPGKPQSFDYETRLGLGFAIRGSGETIAERPGPDGGRVSVLRFWSNSRWSLIREGRGFWSYVPIDGGVRFRTIYDYEPRWGPAGRLIDRVAFRPLIGWATAWSFDRLRLWLERGVDPSTAARVALVHGVARAGLAAIFAWHGLVPKLLTSDPTERAIAAGVGLSASAIAPSLLVIGVAECVMAIGLLLTWHRAGLAWLALMFAGAATVVASVADPSVLTAAFTPVTLNLCLGLLAAIDLLTLDGIPSAGRCRRRPPPVPRPGAAPVPTDQ